MTRASTTFMPWTQAWWSASFPYATAVQTQGWAAIQRGEHALLVAPTGSGKTLAAFLCCIDRLMRAADERLEAGSPRQDPRGKTKVLYVSPLKALVHDINRNLRAPLEGIAAQAIAMQANVHMPSIAVRTGDTTTKERRQQLREPPEILVTTPESLYLLLGSRAREGLRSVDTVILDEAHALADSKRGAHLALSLERLAALTGRDPQRIGLSATARPLSEVARFVGGDRKLSIVDTSEPPHIELVVEAPDEETLPARIAALIESHRSTIVFVNSRGHCERLSHRLNDLARTSATPRLVRAHHGSISHGERREIEEQLKRGELAGIVATSSLELGIDMEAVDLVVLVESPGSVARGLQRVGRAGHGVGQRSVGRLLPKHPGDLLEATVIAERMKRGELEALHMPNSPLDVLAQQIVAMVAVEPISIAALEKLVRRTASYRDLPQSALHAVLDMLAGAYPSTAFADLRPRIVWDRERDLLSTRRGSGMVALVNGGTIPDRGTYAVHVGEGGPRVGELDEEMVYETVPGEVFTLGASSFRVEQVTRDRVIVSPAPGELGKLPFWRGDGPGRPIELGFAVGAFMREHNTLEDLTQRYGLQPQAAACLLEFLDEQRAATGTLPTDRAITIECTRDEVGDYRVYILTPLGSRVHAPWALALSARLSRAHGFEVQAMHSDDGILLRFADTGTPPRAFPAMTLLLPDADEVEALVMEQLPSTALFAGTFRENAARALLMPRRRPGSRVPLWLQRKRAAALLASAQQIPDFPIVLETYRTCLRDIFDMPALRALLTAIADKSVRVDFVETASPSPFARSLALAYMGASLYAGDSPLAERNARMLAEHSSKALRELLGQAALRSLLDKDAVAQVEAELQRLAPDRRAEDLDGLHDLFRALGDLNTAELQARCVVPIEPLLQTLQAQGRALHVSIGGEPRAIAHEDAALYRDALGIALPADLDPSTLKSLPDPLAQLMQRYARTRGPFTVAELAQRYAVPVAQADAWLAPLRAAGSLVQGELRPGGSELEHCDADVLRRLRLRTRSALRARAAPVAASTLVRFLPAWSGIGSGLSTGLGTSAQGPREGLPALEDAIAQLEGLALPLSDLERAILPARVRNYSPALLDQLGATGVVCWVGRGRLGARDGRVALYLRKNVGALLDPATLPSLEIGSAATELQARVAAQLQARGACFFAELVAACAPTTHTELLAALHELMWSGIVTNDSFMPLRAAGPMRTPKAVRPARSRGLGTRTSVRSSMNTLSRMTSGRFSLARTLSLSTLSAVERAHACAQSLLARYGIVSREVAALEELPGGFAALYPVLEAMEEAGRTQRGYFAQGLGGAQFASTGAVDRLRACAETEAPARVLAATDPANPFGWALPWPDDRARRAQGARVVIVDTEPVLFLTSHGKTTIGFPAASDDAHLSAAITALRAATTKSLRIEKIDGQDARFSPLGKRLIALGLAPTYRGIELR